MAILIAMIIVGVVPNVPLALVRSGGCDSEGPAVTSPGQCSKGMLELTAHTLDTVKGRSCTGIVTPEDTHSFIAENSSVTLALSVP